MAKRGKSKNQAENGSSVQSNSASHVAEPCDDLPQPVDIKGWNVYVLDSHSLIFQVFHAIPEMSSPRGEQVGAVFGFVRDILYLIEDKKPNALICAFDLSGPTFRDQLYEAYKAERGEMPADLVTQIPKIKQFLEAMSIPVLTSEGFEADDVLATVARVCDEQGANCFIVTGDKDCRQLITDRVAVFNIRKNQIFDAVALREEWGVSPDQVIDFQALVGDKIDNVPGVPGIGLKTAQQLLETYGTLDNLLEHAADVPGAKGKKLAECREQALLSRQLVRLDSQVPVTPDWDASRVGGFDHEAVTALFAEFGFRSFVDRVAKLTSTTAAPAA
ncbi:MAG TPA: 5'-3' exonuclease H3TH domain-containing protein, partial [Lacipirellulaceae bacterium]|nr:5'-3' exonuclease H3TH domain-containing protein [Lacipirellulaceae bacterium]